MMRNFMYKLGELNPQLLREIKGRWQATNILPAVAISLLGQFILLIYCQRLLPPKYINTTYDYPHAYCTGLSMGSLSQCIVDEYDRVIVNWQLWNQDVFNLLSLIGIFVILVGGTYLLISDLATEERRGTLNFIRLSPQSYQSIFLGKMLGVPILLYVVSLVAVPFHLWLGIHAQIALSRIFGFYAVLIGTSILYFSGALLFGLVGTWLRGFQSWLGSGVILGLLLFTKEVMKDNSTFNYPFVVFRLLNPYFFISNYSGDFELNHFHWFALPLRNSFILTVGFSLIFYLIGTYFIWQSLRRCYLDKNAIMLSKKQSYLLTSSFAIFTLGCANWQSGFVDKFNSYSGLKESLACLMFLNLWLFLYLIATLTPNRQTLQDWSRYRHIYSSQKLGKGKFINDMIWGEKSPGIFAIAINALIAIACLIFLIVFVPSSGNDKLYALLSLIFAGSLAIIYAALAQLVLFMKNEYRLFWANAILVAVMIVPPFILSILSSTPESQPFAWLFTVASPLVMLFSATRDELIIPTFLAIIGHGVILSLLLFKITHQLKKSGDSATKILLAGN
jgi:hypothetical protein